MTTTISRAHPCRINSIIFDYGLVLCEPPEREKIRELCALFEIESDRFWGLYERDRAAYDRGTLGAEEYWKRFAAACNKAIDREQIGSLRRIDIEMWSRLREEMLDWVDSLGTAGYRTAILSNLNSEFAKHLRASATWIHKFNTQVFSSEIGQVKPDAAIYRYCLEQLHRSPDEALFIDDREVNVAAAANEGILGVVYKDIHQLRAKLAELDLGIPLPALAST